MDLSQLRKKIDKLDDEIIILLEERAKLVEEVIKYKESHAIPTADFSREDFIIEKIDSQITSKYKDNIISNYLDIMKNSRHFQDKLRGNDFE